MPLARYADCRARDGGIGQNVQCALPQRCAYTAQPCASPCHASEPLIDPSPAARRCWRCWPAATRGAQPGGRRRRCSSATSSVISTGADAADHRAGDGADRLLRLALSRGEHGGALRSRLGPFDPARAGDLVGAAADHHLPRRGDLDRARICSTRIRPLDRIARGQAGRRRTSSRSRSQVVALDWKWLFIYPEQGIATVNELAAPVDRPIRFEITCVVGDELASTFRRWPADLRHAGHGDEAARRDQQGRRLRRLLGQLQRRRLLATCASSSTASTRPASTHGSPRSKAAAARSTATAISQLEKPSEKEPVRYFAGCRAGPLSRRSSTCASQPGKMCMRRDDAHRREGRRRHGQRQQRRCRSTTTSTPAAERRRGTGAPMSQRSAPSPSRWRRRHAMRRRVDLRRAIRRRTGRAACTRRPAGLRPPASPASASPLITDARRSSTMFDDPNLRSARSSAG